MDTCSLFLHHGEYLELVVEQQGIDLIATLLAPSQEELLKMDSPNGPFGPEPLFWIAEVDGPYTLQVTAGPGQKAGRYQLQVTRSRFPSIADRARATAFLRFQVAEAQHLSSNPELRHQAEDLYRLLAEPWEHLGQPMLAARSWRRLGNLAVQTGDIPRALAAFERALPLYRAHDPGWELVTQLIEASTPLRYVGRTAEARKVLDEALELSKDLGNHIGFAAALNNQGVLHAFLGAPETALTSYHRALRHWEQIDSRPDLAATLHNLGLLYTNLGRLEDALAYLRRAEVIRRQTSSPHLSSTLNTRGWALFQKGLPEEALPLYHEALRTQRKTGDTPGQATTLEFLGQLQQEQEDWESARRSYEEALALVAGGGNRLVEAILSQRLGETLQGPHNASQKDLQQAHALFRRALQELKDLHSPHGQVRALTALAAADRRLGKLTSAQTQLEQALALVEGQRNHLTTYELKFSFFARHRNLFDTLVAHLVDLDALEPGAGHGARALTLSERGRGRGLLDSVADIDWRRRLTRTQKLQERSLRESLHTHAENRIALADVGNTAAAAFEEGKLRHLEEKYRLLEQKLRAELGLNARATPLAAPEIQALLDEHTVMLVLHWGTGEVILWWVDHQGITTHRLASTSQDQNRISLRLNQLLELLPYSYQASRSIPTAERAAELSDLLLGPVAARLDRQRLVVVADGPLNALPFTALLVPETGPVTQRPALLAHHEIVHLPSASLLPALVKRPACDVSREFAVLDDPVFQPTDDRFSSQQSSEEKEPGKQAKEDYLSRSLDDLGISSLQRLPFSGEEAHRLILSLPQSASHLRASGFAATREAILNGVLANSRRVHFATHGLLDNRHPDLSGLVLSLYNKEGERRDGFLRARDIASLDLCTELVVLSACKTALNSDVPGEGLLGLAHAFFLAGARRLVASYWDVDDAATAELMDRFYRAQWKEGLAPAAALRRAQLELLKEERFRAPAFWAGFAMQGDWN